MRPAPNLADDGWAVGGPTVISYLQAIVIGLLQGVTELFPVSSLGHSVLLPALLGWHQVVASQAAQESFYLAFLVGLHVATAVALLAFYWRYWQRIVWGLARSLWRRRIETADERLGWLLVVATLPAGAVGVAFEHALRVLFAKPLAAAVFLTLNGVILLAGERLRRIAPAPAPVGDGPGAAPARDRPSRQVDTLAFGDALLIGASQILAFFAGISRSGVTMVGGLWRGLSHEDAARFAFLLATPVIFAAGVLKIPSLFGDAGAHIHGQVAVGVVITGITAYLSVRFLVRYFETNTLTPFAVYCLLAGAASVVRFAV